jgi:hypothetical protein
MRITRDALVKIAKDTTEKTLAPNRNVTAVFLVGSMLSADPFMGGTTDVDLLVIYNGEPPDAHQIIKLSNEFHIDICYESASLYAQPRELRGDPWRGYAMWNPTLLHQKGRFFEYTQSSLRAQFDDPANKLKRAYAFSAPAREAWSGMQFDPENVNPLHLLNAAANAANAVAVLSGEPLTERRLLAGFPARAQAIGNPDFIRALLEVFGRQMNIELVREWLPAWEDAFSTAGLAPLDLSIHTARLGYYKSAITTLLESDFPLAAIWPMIFTWAKAAEAGNFTSEHHRVWMRVLALLGLDSVGMPERVDALDRYLDTLEETLEKIAAENGL